MSNFEKLMAAEFEKCLAPGVLLGCGHYACSHHAHGYGPQPVTTVLDPDTEQESESHVNKPVAVRARMTDAEILATIDRGLAKDIDRRISYLLKRREEIYDLMAKDREMRREWKAKVKAKFEECEVQKRVLLANMKREHRMVVVKREFILALMRMDFVEEEIEDIYGAGRVGICEGE